MGYLLGYTIIGFLCFLVIFSLRRKNHIDFIYNQKIESASSVVSMFPKNKLDLDKLVKKCKSVFKKNITAILATDRASRNFDSTFGALDKATRNIASVRSVLDVLKYLSPNQEMRKLARDKSLCLGKMEIELVYSKKLFKVLKDYNQDRLDKKTIDREFLAEEIYFIERMLETLELDGLAIQDDGLFDQFKSLHKAELQLGIEFSKNIDQVTTKLEFDLAELAGVNQDKLDSLERTEDGKVLVGLDYPTYFEIIKNCCIPKTRELIYKTFNSRAWPQNEVSLSKLVKTRAKMAEILGLESFAHKDIKLMMAKTPERVDSFLDEISAMAEKKFLQEFKEVTQDLPEGVCLDENGQLKGWDIAYLAENYRKTKFNLDENKIKEYFPIEKTIDGLFKIYQKLLNVEFKIHKNVGLWDDEVKIIEVFDMAKKRVQGFIIVDLYPRPNKYSHACEIGIINTVEGPNGFCPAVCCVVANLPQEMAGKPALLKLSDVRTFFHEFGHAMHQLLGTTRTNYFSGTGVLWDFVETPSTMFEEWLWEPTVLKRISSHYQTGESLPDSIIENLIESRSFFQGHMFLRAVGLSKFSLQCYRTASESVDFSKLYDEIFSSIIPQVESQSQDKMFASFGHLSGYGPKYYTYLWSMVFSADLFEHLLELGLETPLAGQKVRTLLSMGGRVRPERLLEDFLGRAPEMDALAKRFGLKEFD